MERIGSTGHAAGTRQTEGEEALQARIPLEDAVGFKQALFLRRREGQGVGEGVHEGGVAHVGQDLGRFLGLRAAALDQLAAYFTLITLFFLMFFSTFCVFNT